MHNDERNRYDLNRSAEHPGKAIEIVSALSIPSLAQILISKSISEFLMLGSIDTAVVLYKINAATQMLIANIKVLLT